MQGPKTHEQQLRILEKKPDMPDARRATTPPTPTARNPDARQSEFPVSRHGMNQESDHNKHNDQGHPDTNRSNTRRQKRNRTDRWRKQARNISGRARKGKATAPAECRATLRSRRTWCFPIATRLSTPRSADKTPNGCRPSRGTTANYISKEGVASREASDSSAQ